MDDQDDLRDEEEVDPLAGLELIVRERLADEPDIRIAHKPEDYHEGPLEVAWQIDDNGDVTVTIKADCRIKIEEIGGADGPVYVSTTFTKRRPKLQDAISLAVRNEIQRAFMESWRKFVPSSRAQKDQAMALQTDNANLRASINENASRLRELLGDEEFEEMFGDVGSRGPVPKA